MTHKKSSGEIERQMKRLLTQNGGTLIFDEDEVGDVPTGALTPQEKRFADFYVEDCSSAARAAVRAGTDPQWASMVATKWLKTPKIASYIATEMLAREDRTKVTKDRVLNELAILAFSDVSNYRITDEGDVEVKDGVPEFALRAIQSIKRKVRIIPRKDDDPITEVDVEIKLWSKPDALRMAGSSMAMFVEKHADPDGRPLGTGAMDELAAKAESVLLSVHAKLNQLADRRVRAMKQIAEIDGYGNGEGGAILAGGADRRDDA